MNQKRGEKKRELKNKLDENKDDMGKLQDLIDKIDQ